MTGARVCRKPHTPAPRKAITPVPSAHSTAALFGCSRRRLLTTLKANSVIMKNGIGSSAENTEPHTCQYAGAPIQK
ncbi:hypothetical protein D3C85_1538370 [compost metagenome]